MVEILGKVLQRLEQGDKHIQHQVVAGFDGFIDNLVCPVKTLIDENNTDYFNSIADFGGYITSKAGKSCSIQLHPVMKKIGGNTPIFGKAIAALGITTTCIGAFGYPKMEDLFQEEVDNLAMLSIANPGYCTALEFDDGKVMLADNQGIKEVNYHILKKRLDEKKLIRILEDSDIISLMNWSEVVGSASIWEGILEEIFPKIKSLSQKKIFIDISDCSGRSGEDIEELIGLIQRFSGVCAVVLSLNRNEFEHLTEKLHCSGDIKKQMKELKKRCGLYYLVIHDSDGAYVIESGNGVFLENKYNHQPQILTGGGDNFNAGLVYGMVMGMSLEESAIVANAASGYYVTNAKSPSMSQLKEFIVQWKNDVNQESETNSESLKLQKIV